MAPQYEDTIGKWVARRCSLRRDRQGLPMPEKKDLDVKGWVREIGHPRDPDPNVEIPGNVLEWLCRTLHDPGWQPQQAARQKDATQQAVGK